MEDAARRQKTLKKLESKLCRLLSEETSPEKMTEAVKKVREAKLSLFKGQREIAKYQEIEDNPEYKLNVENHLANLESKRSGRKYLMMNLSEESRETAYNQSPKWRVYSSTWLNRQVSRVVIRRVS